MVILTNNNNDIKYTAEEANSIGITLYEVHIRSNGTGYWEVLWRRTVGEELVYYGLY